MSDQPQPACKTCRFVLHEGGNTYCRRKPPFPFIVGNVMAQPIINAYFPPVGAEWWCGEHKPSVEALRAQGDVVQLTAQLQPESTS